MDNQIEKQIEEMKTGIGALAEIASMFYNSLRVSNMTERLLLTKAFIDSFMDHLSNPRGSEDD